MRIVRKIAATATAVVLAGVVGGGVAQASPSAVGALGAHAPSACRPANHMAKISAAPASSGHRHYRVTLTAARGYESCRLAGSPTDVRFYHHGAADKVTAGRYGAQNKAVTFGPGHPVHFDIQVPNGKRGARADEAAFTLRAPGGVIPGKSTAHGQLTVSAGTVIGPVQAGA
ncbi:DUF4232 domain-containing protein [Streptomyces sp. NBC_00083]|uniref:DUF4232 domain-containing protein n=1 Tax=Streptomyces sp. NBC_00083 TaxID=2975647 RepID=UPI00225425A4|nr:DUF4232 domain-containing protein [Streptomyces sp. NBC_00083]MCX5387244.1 DUF4232 domain-containing protein [Streptomyces sp. NBC_00083]